MKKLAEITENVECRITGDEQAAVEAITIDSRSAGPNSLFAALRGEQLDGNKFVPSAIEKGASVILSEEPAPEDLTVTWVQTDDARAALASVAKAFHGRPDEKLKLAGITGTNGKTTTARVISKCLDSLLGPCGVIGSVGHEYGGRSLRASLTTPESHESMQMMADMVREGCRSAVMEASSVGIDRHRVTGFDFDALVFTNFSRDHIDYHGSMENYFEAKAALFESSNGGKTAAVLNADDPAVVQMTSRINLKITTFGIAETADLQLVKLDLQPEKSKLVLRWGGETHQVETRLIGRYNAHNVCAGMATLLSLGFAMDEIKPLIPDIEAVSGRLEPVAIDRPFTVVIDFAHTDDALLKLLQAAREITRGRLIVIFGCGGDRDKGKRPLMGAHAVSLADLAVLTSDNPRSEDPGAIIDDVLEGINQVDEPAAGLHVEIDRRKAIGWTLSEAREGDTIILAGKGHELYQEIEGVKHPFDERAVVRELLESL